MLFRSYLRTQVPARTLLVALVTRFDATKRSLSVVLFTKPASVSLNKQLVARGWASDDAAHVWSAEAVERATEAIHKAASEGTGGGVDAMV